MKSSGKKITTIFLFLISSILGFGQISIEFPVERTVFQRNNSNLGNVNVFGNLSQDCDRVEARLVARSAGQGVSTSWVTIDSEIEGLAFSGKIQTAGGWYRLEVRGVKNDNILFSSTVERVGIGEVFVIAGQSNAQGDGSNPNASGAVDDRVNAFRPNYFNSGLDRYVNIPDYLNEISFTRINAATNIGPGGVTAWCYGELGDMLVSRLNVPVLFFNAAFTGTSSRNWRLSAEGQAVNHEVYTNDPILQSGSPYLAFKTTIQSVNTLLGIRGILWHQGEYDRLVGNRSGISAGEHYLNLKAIIERSRNDIGVPTLPWLVSRVSRYEGIVDPRVLEGQNYTISAVPYVWAGPATDDIQPNRYDGGHFQNVPGSMGLTQLANAWNASLTDNFFGGSNPVVARDIQKLRHYCSSQSSVRLSLDNAFREYSWNNGNRGSTLEAGSGYYYAAMRDASGNVFRSNTIIVEDVFPKSGPNISAPDGLEGCNGFTLPLLASADSKYSVRWNTGATTNELGITSPGVYSAQYRTSQNCFSASSQNYSINFRNPPSKPSLMFVNGDGNQCEGEEIVVTVTNMQGAEARWSTGLASNQISFDKELDQNLTVTLYSLPNCPSPSSDVVKYEFYPTPAKPALSISGPYYLKAESFDNGAVFNWNLDGNSVGEDVGQYFHLERAGLYRAQAKHDYTASTGRTLTCFSDFSEELLVEDKNTLTSFSVYPNPVSDGVISITSDGEKENLKVRVFDELGREIFNTSYSTISYPRTLDLRSYNLQGKYFIRLEHQAQSKTVPMLFVK